MELSGAYSPLSGQQHDPKGLSWISHGMRKVCSPRAAGREREQVSTVEQGKEVVSGSTACKRTFDAKITWATGTDEGGWLPWLRAVPAKVKTRQQSSNASAILPANLHHPLSDSCCRAPTIARGAYVRLCLPLHIYLHSCCPCRFCVVSPDFPLPPSPFLFLRLPPRLERPSVPWRTTFSSTPSRITTVFQSSPPRPKSPKRESTIATVRTRQAAPHPSPPSSSPTTRSPANSQPARMSTSASSTRRASCSSAGRSRGSPNSRPTHTILTPQTRTAAAPSLPITLSLPTPPRSTLRRSYETSLKGARFDPPTSRPSSEAHAGRRSPILSCESSA